MKAVTVSPSTGSGTVVVMSVLPFALTGYNGLGGSTHPAPCVYQTLGATLAFRGRLSAPLIPILYHGLQWLNQCIAA